jgi:hypothetical protein
MNKDKVAARVPTRIPRLLTVIALIAFGPIPGHTQGTAAWLDQPTPTPWNKAGSSIPTAPKVEGATLPRCRDQARPAQLDEDKRLRDQGWDLVGPYQGGWGVIVIRATAGYDGMCRPRQYQDFVFVGGAFAGTLSPQPMDSRTDGSLVRTFIESGTRLTGEYQRYASRDPLCCPSRTTHVIFETASDRPAVRPISTSTSRVNP